MTWKPDRRQLETLADMGNAHMPVEAIAAALDVHPDDLRTWIGRLVATRFRDVPEPPTLPPPAPPAFKGHRPDRVLADRLFEAQPDAHIDDLADEY